MTAATRTPHYCQACMAEQPGSLVLAAYRADGQAWFREHVPPGWTNYGTPPAGAQTAQEAA